jgi:DNA-3-methyladenine glycosylase
MAPQKIDREFYLGTDVVHIARELLGKVISTNFEGAHTSGMITETEAYAGIMDKASHAYGDRRTTRTAPMYAQGGTAYVYLCYGIHHLFNIVTNVEGIPHAILVRGILPLEGLPTIVRRRGGNFECARVPNCNGPGIAAQALGIHTIYSGTDLLHGPITIADHGHHIDPEDVIAGPRIGVDFAGDDALLPYRFRIAPSRLASITGTKHNA